MPDLTLQDLYDRGLDSRMIEYWIARRLLRPIVRGRGTPREWPAKELHAADLMRRLTAAGFTAEAAARHARTHLDGRPLIPLGDGLTLAIDTDFLTRGAS